MDSEIVKFPSNQSSVLKKSLKFVQHLLKAKGRHGTHSPFVYAFVEQVLRKKNTVGNRFSSTNNVRFSRKQILLLKNTIDYLKPKNTLVLNNVPSFIAQLVASLSTNAEVSAAETITYNDIAENLIIVDVTTALKLVRLPIFQQNKNMQILVVSPHQHQDVEVKWQDLIGIDHFNMTLDYWHFGLLLADPAFKIKQHFRLR